MTLDILIFYWYIDICFFLILLVIFALGYLCVCQIDHSAQKKERSEIENQKKIIKIIERKNDLIKQNVDELHRKIQNNTNKNLVPYHWAPYSRNICLVKLSLESSDIQKRIWEDFYKKIYEIIDNSKHELSPVSVISIIYRKQMFSHTVWAISGLLLKIQAVICFFWLCIFALGKIYETVSPEIDLLVYCPKSAECAKLTAGLSYASVCIWGAFTLIIMVLALIFLRKGLRYFIMQYDIIFFGYKMLTYILFSEKPNSKHISEEFGELSEILRQKNSDNFWEKIFHHRSCW